jgi:damage-control phosphatase, subfamily I
MKTNPECIPCFLNQALKAMSVIGGFDSPRKERVLKRIMGRLASFDSDLSPPEFAILIYGMIEEEAGGREFYGKIKEKDVASAKSAVPIVERVLMESEDRLYDLCRMAIGGNNMDFAVNTDYDIAGSILEHAKSELAIDDFREMVKEIKGAEKIAYILDNAGEAVFDKMLIEEIRGKTRAGITVLVRSRPILNDVTLEDAEALGFGKIPGVEIEGVDTVFPFENKSGTMKRILDESDLIISKGQANYECLSDSKKSIYFLLAAKCDVIARDIGVEKKGLVLLKGNNTHAGLF